MSGSYFSPPLLPSPSDGSVFVFFNYCCHFFDMFVSAGRFPLYGDVTADPSGVQAEHRHQTLHVRIPVVHIPKETEERELRIVEAKRIAKTIKFPSEIKKSIVEAAERRAKKSEKRRRKKDAEQFYDDPRFDIGVVRSM